MTYDMTHQLSPTNHFWGKRAPTASTKVQPTQLDWQLCPSTQWEKQCPLNSFHAFGTKVTQTHMTCNRNSLSKQLLKVVFVCVCVLSLPMVLDFTNIAQLDRWFKGCVDRWWETSFFFFFLFCESKSISTGFHGHMQPQLSVLFQNGFEIWKWNSYTLWLQCPPSLTQRYDCKMVCHFKPQICHHLLLTIDHFHVAIATGWHYIIALPADRSIPHCVTSFWWKTLWKWSIGTISRVDRKFILFGCSKFSRPEVIMTISKWEEANLLSSTYNDINSKP